MHTFRLTIASLSILSLLGCSTAYQAHLRGVGDRPGLDENITHCLASVGLEDESRQRPSAEFIAEDSELKSIWSTPGCKASVRRKAGQWYVIFVPGGSFDAAEAAEVLSDGFARCIELHLAGVTVQVDSKPFLDLR